MVCPLYLAMTPAEFYANNALPGHWAWFACHFAPDGKDLSNLPRVPIPGAMLVLDDLTPLSGHDPRQILKTLTALRNDLNIAKILLDFQRPNCAETRQLVELLARNLDIELGISHHYMQPGRPVLVPPVPPGESPEKHLKQFPSHSLWLELADDVRQVAVAPNGAAETSPGEMFPTPVHRHPNLCCSYQIRHNPNRVDFRLFRDTEDQRRLLRRVSELGISCAVGFYRELSGI